MIETAKMIDNGPFAWRHFSAILSLGGGYLPVAGFSQMQNNKDCYLHTAYIAPYIDLSSGQDFKLPELLCNKWNKDTLSVPSVTLFDVSYRSEDDVVSFGASQSSQVVPNDDSKHNYLFRTNTASGKIYEIEGDYKAIGMRINIIDDNYVGVILSSTNG